MFEKIKSDGKTWRPELVTSVRTNTHLVTWTSCVDITLFVLLLTVVLCTMWYGSYVDSEGYKVLLFVYGKMWFIVLSIVSVILWKMDRIISFTDDTHLIRMSVMKISNFLWNVSYKLFCLHPSYVCCHNLVRETVLLSLCRCHVCFKVHTNMFEVCIPAVIKLP
jgi:hypothetical protein